MDLDLAIDTEDPAYQLRDKSEVVRNGEDGHPVGQTFQDLKKLDFNTGVNVGGGLIKEEDFRFTGQGPGNENTLPLTTGQAVERARRQTINSKFRHGLESDPPVFGAVASKPDRTGPTHEHYIHDRDRKRGIILQVLRHIPNLGPRLMRGNTQDFNGAALRGEQSQDQLEQGRFSAAIGANQGHRIQSLNDKGDIRENGYLSIRERDLIALDDRSGGRRRICLRFQG